jgi:hypothetical protein
MSAVISSLAQVSPQIGNLVSANPDRYAVLGLILLSPLLGAIINGFFGKKIGREGVYITAVSTVAMSFLFSLFAYFTLYRTTHAPVPARYVVDVLWDWFLSGSCCCVDDGRRHPHPHLQRRVHVP